MTITVDDVQIVHVDIVSRYPESRGEVVAAGVRGGEFISQDDLILGVVLVLGRISIYDDLPADFRDDDLARICSWLDEDCSRGRGASWDGVDGSLEL